MSTSVEQEQRRRARELHDGPLQVLATLRMQVDAALAQGNPAQAQQALRTLGERIDTEIQQLRATIDRLRLPVLDEGGLRYAIERLAGQLADAHDIEVETMVDGGDTELSPALEAIAYRVVEEAVRNVARHARARRVLIAMLPCALGVRVTVRDDGVGFDPDAPRLGYGLIGMRERVELAGGELAILSRPGSGTTVEALLRAPTPAPV